jgi:hypothetical protein
VRRATELGDDTVSRDQLLGLARSMHYPTRWDPFFTEVMTLQQIYHYPNQHFDFHRTKLSLPPAGETTPT